MSLKNNDPSNTRRGRIQTTTLHLDRSADGLPDVYQFVLEGSDEAWTVSTWPYERAPAVGDTVLLFKHPDFPTHCSTLVYDAPLVNS